MDLKEYRILFRLICLGLILVTTFSFLSMVFPYQPTGERFFVLSLLGRDRTAENYYLNDYPALGAHEMQWYISVQNFMQETQYVLVKVKVLNSTMSFPDLVMCTPSPESPIMNFSVFLGKGQSSTIPFFWKIINYSFHDESLIIDRIEINKNPVSLNVSSSNDSGFQIIFELWYYDPVIEDFRFNWDSGFGIRCSWNQIDFTVVPEQ